MLLIRPIISLSELSQSIHLDGHTGTELDTEGLPCPQDRIAHGNSGGFLVYLDGSLVRIDSDDLWMMD